MFLGVYPLFGQIKNFSILCVVKKVWFCWCVAIIRHDLFINVPKRYCDFSDFLVFFFFFFAQSNSYTGVHLEKDQCDIHHSGPVHTGATCALTLRAHVA